MFGSSQQDRERLASLEAELTSARRDLDAARSAAETAKQETADARAALQAAEAEKAEASAARAHAEAAHAELKASADEATAKVEEYGLLARIVEGSDAAFMVVDEDFVVTYVNQSTSNLLRRAADEFRKTWPDFNPDALIGSCIDRFHTNPAHQRGMLSTPLRAPHLTDIKVGDMTIALRVTSNYDNHGNHVGSTLEWEDVTEKRAQAVRDADFRGKLLAVSKSMASIEFDPDGTILDANDIFCRTMGYSLNEIVGQKHRMFVTPEFAASTEYDSLWQRLARGESVAGEVPRVHKNGKHVWLQANYSPVTDQHGNVVKVVKFASDITAQKELQETTTRALGEVAYAMKAAAHGDLSRRVQGEYTGEFGELKHAVNTSFNVIENDVINESVRVMGSMASGDLSQRMNPEMEGLYGQLARAVNESQDNLAGIVSEINRVSESVDTGSSEISQGNTDLSRRTEQQAASLEETASSMEQMTSTVTKNADNANQANHLALEARDHAERGGEVVRNAIKAMDDINEASSKISDIIGVIDEIAFQTNLLALNASVEAARAGDQGRGFAVVASEVRNLAGRSATAAREIKDLINDSGSKVEEGSRLVNESGETLSDIVDGVKKVTDIVGEIAAASAEQRSGIQQVNQAISQMDELTQQNAALVEEAAVASESLSEQAQTMSTLMSQFKIGAGASNSASFGAPAGEERRSASRPWSGSPGGAANGAANGSGMGMTGTDDQTWQDF